MCHARGDGATGDGLLLSSCQVLYLNFAAGRFVLTHDGYESCLARVRILEGLAEILAVAQRLRMDPDAETGGAQLARQRQRLGDERLVENRDHHVRPARLDAVGKHPPPPHDDEDPLEAEREAA